MVLSHQSHWSLECQDNYAIFLVFPFFELKIWFESETKRCQDNKNLSSISSSCVLSHWTEGLAKSWNVLSTERSQQCQFHVKCHPLLLQSTRIWVCLRFLPTGEFPTRHCGSFTALEGLVGFFFWLCKELLRRLWMWFRVLWIKVDWMIVWNCHYSSVHANIFGNRWCLIVASFSFS